ncbi:hypothetical protein [Streptomyces sp. NPDC057199]|uniref:hypothetical protein n=1 Tax=Streptomyces sp. NPDC057199 TaxID=3346047 RepID=UPI00362A49EA
MPASHRSLRTHAESPGLPSLAFRHLTGRTAAFKWLGGSDFSYDASTLTEESWNGWAVKVDEGCDGAESSHRRGG